MTRIKKRACRDKGALLQRRAAWKKYVVVLSNIEPKTIAGMTSEAMLLAADDGTNVSLRIPDKALKPGSKIR